MSSFEYSGLDKHLPCNRRLIARYMADKSAATSCRENTTHPSSAGIALGAFRIASAFAQEAPQTFTAKQLTERTLHRRAVEAIIWGIPLVNYDLMFQSMVRDANGGMNQILYWSNLADWKNQYLTPNPDTIYFTPFFSTKDVGTLVLEIPPADDGSITGTIMDSWKRLLKMSRRPARTRARVANT
jgi:hypothetical protein